MTDHPIIFSAPMVRALLDGRKTMTRRLAWGAANGNARIGDVLVTSGPGPTGGKVPAMVRPSPWQGVKSGDRLWVREKIHVRPIASAMHAYSYFDEEDASILGGWKKVRLLLYDHQIKRPERPVWRPSIHIPRELSRLTLVVTATKIEQLHKITEADVLAEGVPLKGIERHAEWFDRRDCPGIEFGLLWDSLHGNGSWDANPEVVALTFSVHQQNIDALPKA